MRKLLLTLACSLVFSAPVLASGSVQGDRVEHGNQTGMADGVHTTGEIHAIQGSKVDLSHEPIPEIGWPAMRMDLPVLEGADTGGVVAGDKVMIMLQKGPDGTYGIRALEKIN